MNARETIEIGKAVTSSLQTRKRGFINGLLLFEKYGFAEVSARNEEIYGPELDEMMSREDIEALYQYGWFYSDNHELQCWVWHT